MEMYPIIFHPRANLELNSDSLTNRSFLDFVPLFFTYVACVEKGKKIGDRDAKGKRNSERKIRPRRLN